MQLKHHSTQLRRQPVAAQAGMRRAPRRRNPCTPRPAYTSNLGALEGMATRADAPRMEIDPYMQQRVSPERRAALRRVARRRVAAHAPRSLGCAAPRPPLPPPPHPPPLSPPPFLHGSFANRGFAVDGGTAFVNVALLLLLFALAFERILGLDKARAPYSAPRPRCAASMQRAGVRRAPACARMGGLHARASAMRAHAPSGWRHVRRAMRTGPPARPPASRSRLNTPPPTDARW